MNNLQNRVLNPREFSGSIHGDYGFEINGVRSERGYVSRNGARQAMYRLLESNQN